MCAALFHADPGRRRYRVLSVEETLLLERSATSSATSEGLGSAVVARRGGGAAGGAGRAAGELQGEAGTSVGAGEETPSKAKALAPARGVAAALEGIKVRDGVRTGLAAGHLRRRIAAVLRTVRLGTSSVVSALSSSCTPSS